MTAWQLPTRTQLGGRVFDLRTDYREILQIIDCLEDPDLPEIVRWLVALELFYGQTVPAAHRQAAMEYLAWFLRGGASEDAPGPKLLDWQQDADAIVAGVNRVAGQEVRSLSYLHWWTFLSFFHGIGEGQLSTLVTIRDKLARGKKLESWEKDFYRENKKKVDISPRYSQAELAEQQRLKALLNGQLTIDN